MAQQTTGQVDLFGQEIMKDIILRDKYIEPPFSLLNKNSGTWRNRTRLWKSKGIQSEIGREAKAYNTAKWLKEKADRHDKHKMSDTSIFDPTLCEIMYHWFCPHGGRILDSFAGGSVRGIVANYLGYKYTGIDIRPEQIKSNNDQAKLIIPDNMPKWICGDSNIELMKLGGTKKFVPYDMLFTCPPYGDLEVYSKIPGDISNMPYSVFLRFYREIIAKSIALLKPESYAVIVVGEIRNKKGDYVGFVPDTVRAFLDAGMKYYNEAILMDSAGGAAVRASGNMKYQKLVKIHQNVLVFRK